MNRKKYYICHGEDIVAWICKDGSCEIKNEQFLPYNLYLENVLEKSLESIDVMINNITNFYYWCASRVLTLDRVYAKEILNSIGMPQAQTDKERANIALTYHCLSLTDIYWVKEENEQVIFSKINLYENHLSGSFVDIFLRGKQMTVENSELIADDLGTKGYFPKAWIREKDGFYLLKDGGSEVVQKELLASRVCQCFSCNQVVYESYFYNGEETTRSKLISSLEMSIVSMEYFTIYAENHGISVSSYIENLDGYSFHMMNILDYLIGNTDRHWGNWGVLVDNKTNQPLRLYDLMDFNKSFECYETLDGGRCLTRKNMTQKQAAIEGVEKVGLNQIKEVKKEWFDDMERWEMFQRRLSVLKDNL